MNDNWNKYIKNNRPQFYLNDKIFIYAAFISSTSTCHYNGLGPEYMLCNLLNLRTEPKLEQISVAAVMPMNYPPVWHQERSCHAEVHGNLL